MKIIRISQVPPAAQATLMNNQQSPVQPQAVVPQQDFSKLMPAGGKPINRNVVGQLLNKLKLDVSNFSGNLDKMSDPDILSQVDLINKRVQTILWSIQSGTKKTQIGDQRILEQTRNLTKQDFNQP